MQHIVHYLIVSCAGAAGGIKLKPSILSFRDTSPLFTACPSSRSAEGSTESFAENAGAAGRLDEAKTGVLPPFSRESSTTGVPAALFLHTVSLLLPSPAASLAPSDEPVSASLASAGSLSALSSEPCEGKQQIYIQQLVRYTNKQKSYYPKYLLVLLVQSNQIWEQLTIYPAH